MSIVQPIRLHNSSNTATSFCIKITNISSPVHINYNYNINYNVNICAICENDNAKKVNCRHNSAQPIDETPKKAETPQKAETPKKAPTCAQNSEN